MKKQLSEKTTYTPNSHVKVVVENKPVQDDKNTQYEQKVTITVKAGIYNDKLAFATDEDIEKFMEKIDFSDPQTELIK
jgi:hypothetical protein